MAVSSGHLLIPDWGGENSLQTTVVGLGPLLTTWWCYSLTVKWGPSQSSPEKPPKYIPPKYSPPLNTWNFTEMTKKKKKTLSFFFVCDTLSSCQGCDATLQKLLLANVSVHTMYK